MVFPLPPLEEGRPHRSTGLLAVLVVVALVAGAWWINGGDPGTPTSRGEEFTDPRSGLPWADRADLDPAVRDVLDAIDLRRLTPDEDGRPYPDAAGLLPQQDAGYYVEYDVPGAPDAHVVVGTADGGVPRERYVTENAYRSVERVRE